MNLNREIINLSDSTFWISTFVLNSYSCYTIDNFCFPHFFYHYWMAFRSSLLWHKNNYLWRHTSSPVKLCSYFDWRWGAVRTKNKRRRRFFSDAKVQIIIGSAKSLSSFLLLQYVSYYKRQWVQVDICCQWCFECNLFLLPHLPPKEHLNLFNIIVHAVSVFYPWYVKLGKGNRKRRRTTLWLPSQIIPIGLRVSLSTRVPY